MRFARDGWSIEAGLAKGRKPPQWYLDEPEPDEVSEFYLAAFFDLSTTRSIGLSAGPIPWNHIRDYADFAGLDRLNAMDFAAIIRRLDGHYLDHLRLEGDKLPDGAKGAALPSRVKSFRGRKA